MEDFSFEAFARETTDSLFPEVPEEILTESSLNPIIDSHSVEWLKGYQSAIRDIADQHVQETIESGAEQLVAAKVLGGLIAAKEKREAEEAAKEVLPSDNREWL